MDSAHSLQQFAGAIVVDDGGAKRAFIEDCRAAAESTSPHHSRDYFSDSSEVLQKEVSPSPILSICGIKVDDARILRSTLALSVIDQCQTKSLLGQCGGISEICGCSPPMLRWMDCGSSLMPA